MERSSLRLSHSVTSHAASIPCRRPSGEPPRTAERGFTLVELMIVVAIVGVLAILAVVGFSKLIGSSRTTEAMGTVNAIKVAQEAYHSETGAYANLSKALCATTTCASLYPQEAVSKPVGNYKVGWGVACGSACNAGMDWSMLPVHVSGGVMYGYSTIAGPAGTTFAAGSGATVPSTWPGGFTVVMTGTQAADWYLVTGVGDENDDGTPCVVLGSSVSNDLAVMNEGN
jgi:type IV pilus assembly protein PilA